MRTAILLLLSIVLVPGSASADDKPSSKNARAILANAEQFELYSLNPAKEDKDGFHGHTVLGKTLVKQAAGHKQIVAALYKGLADSNGTAALCFIPRHGIRATLKGKTVDAVICFECYQVQFHMGGKSETETLTRSPEKVFDEVLKKAGVPLAKKAK